jgi:hypothetical protein
MLKPFISLLLFSLIAIISIDKTNNKAMANTMSIRKGFRNPGII